MNTTETIYTGYGQRILQPGIEQQERDNSRHGSRAAGSAPANVAQMLSRFPHLPTQTAVLGVCEDGIPVLFDLLDDQPGPLLVIGDRGVGKTRLLQTMIQTAISLNSPYEVKYSVVASSPDEWTQFYSSSSEDHCYAFCGNFEDTAPEAIRSLMDLAEQRRSGRQMGAAHLLVIDDLRFMAKADFETRVSLEWLFKNGPAQQVWPVVSLPTQAGLEMSRVVSNFRTRLIGHIAEPANNRLTLFGGIDTQNLETGKQFAVRVQEQWLSFWIPSRV